MVRHESRELSPGMQGIREAVDRFSTGETNVDAFLAELDEMGKQQEAELQTPPLPKPALRLSLSPDLAVLCE